jgi:hypothetical protein
MKLLYLHRTNLVLLVPLFILSSCLLAPEEENFVTVKPEPDLNNMGDVTYSFDGGKFYNLVDTLWASGERLYFRFENGKVLGYEVKLNGESIEERADAVEFTLTTDTRPAGNYRLEITTFVQSGTGSLADKLKAEYYAVTYEIALIVGKDVSFVPKITSIVQKDGTVKLSWTRYPHSDFQAYEIYKYENSSANIYTKYRALKVEDIAVTSIDDSTYVGRIVWYTVRVNRGGKYFESATKQFNISYRPNAQLTDLGGGRVRLSWDQPPFYRNIGSIRLGRYNGTIIENLSPDNLSYEFQEPAIKFGELRDYSITFTGRVSDPGRIEQDRSYYFDDITIGRRLPPHNSIVYNAAEQSYYMILQSQYYSEYPDALYKVDKDLKIIDSVKYNAYVDNVPLVQSADGQRLYAFDYNMIRPVDRNIVSFSEGYRVDRTVALRNQDNVSVSNTNFIVFPSNADVTILNFNTKEIVSRMPGTPKGLHISADGQYVISDSKLYSFNGSTYVHTATLPYTGILYARFLDAATKVLVATDTKVILYDYTTNAETASYEFNTSIYAIPHFNQRSSQYQAGGVFIDINNGTTKTVGVYGAYSTFRLEGEYFFTNSGFALKPY